MTHSPAIPLSIIAPAHNEEENVRPLVAEIVAALEPTGIEYEVIIIDDGSTDRTAAVLAELLLEHERLRVIRMADTPAGRGHGQSAAFHAGLRAARGEVIAVLDADLQNDPADIPRMLEIMRTSGADLVQGDRSSCRQDTLARKFGSWAGRFFRRHLLADTIRDTACSLRVIRREVALAIPLEYRGMHRYIPITARHLGYRVMEVPVNHRPRVAGVAKYGTWDRAKVGLFDCYAVRWMAARRRPVQYIIVERAVGNAAAPGAATVTDVSQQKSGDQFPPSETPDTSHLTPDTSTPRWVQS